MYNIINKMNNNKLIYNAIRTPDGTVLESVHTHDYREHVDANGKTYMIDGGTDYIRRSANGDEVGLAVYLEEGHEKVREVLKWGTRGKDGKQPLRYVVLKDMDTDHIQACLDTQLQMGTKHRAAMVNELTYRKL
jgi:hypothetical protein